MLGAIAGDIIGSTHEFEHPRVRHTHFTLFPPQAHFTDDTVLTVAIAHALLSGEDYASALRRFGTRYSNIGYGAFFSGWLADPTLGPYNSWGNGSAMRVSPVGWAFDDPDQVLSEARRSAAVTHNHPEGIKGAQAIALAIFLARRGEDKAQIAAEIEQRFGYDLSTPLDQIRPDYTFDESCQGTVPPALRAFLESEDYESAVRLAVSLGGDADTLACITGSVAEAYYRSIPPHIVTQTRQRLTQDLLEVVDRFRQRYNLP